MENIQMFKKTRIATIFTGVGLLLALAIVVASAANGNVPLDDPIPESIPQSQVKIKLETVATGLTAPNWGISASDVCEDHLFVTDQDGTLWSINLKTGEKSIFLDVSDRLVALGAFGPGSFDERGLLGVAFHPDYEENGLLYTYTSEPVNGVADFSTMPAGEIANHQTVIMEWQVSDPEDSCHSASTDSGRELLRIDQPQFNHDGGAINFGPDDMLYIALGDGGAADDQGIGHAPDGNGQDPSNILGNMLRIDPEGDNSANGQYGIPDDNPFVDQAGYLDEIFAYGFRNPFRFSFDSRKGDMYIGDVGQNDIEEIHYLDYKKKADAFEDAGGNFGWRLKEGSFCFDPNGDDRGFVFDCDLNDDLIDPIAEYDHDEGIAIIGGFVYRGDEIKDLRGRYVFGDFRRSFSENGRLFHLDKDDEIVEFQLIGQDGLGLSLLGFGQDDEGELYVLANATGTPFGDTGVILKMTPLEELEFEADLTGSAEAPPVTTDTSGKIEVKFNEALTAAEFELKIRDGIAITQAHFHCAPADANGPVVAFLYGFVPGGFDVDGELAEFTLTDANIAAVGSDCTPSIGMTIDNISDLAEAMQAGNIYVNVHSVANPSGEVRGQLEED